MIYNSRYLLDPTALYNMTSNVNADLDRAIERERRRRDELNKYLNQGVKAFAGGAGKAIDEGMKVSRENEEREARNSYVRDMLQGNDPVSRAAADEYIRTGNANPILQRQMQIETMKAREAEKRARDLENSRKQEYNRIIEQTQLKPVYMEAVKKMNDAIDAGNFEDAEIFRSQANSISTKAGTNWGIDLDQVSEARKKTALEKQAEKIDEVTRELAKQKQNENSFNTRMRIETNVLPNATTIEDKSNYKKMVETLYATHKLTDEDRKILHEKIDAISTLEEQIKKAVEGAKASKTGEKTGKAIDEAENRAQAKTYIGKVISELEWDIMDPDVKDHIVRDGTGKVTGVK